MHGFHFTPLPATVLFVLAIVAGYQFRKNWRDEGPVWKSWFFGGVAAIGLISLAFIPVLPA